MLLFTNNIIASSLDVDVVAAGTRPRWPGAIAVSLSKATLSFDQAARFTIAADGTAPYSGAMATGLVTISSKGKELARVTLTPTKRTDIAQAYPLSLGENPITINYAGDANFLPMTLTSSLSATIGSPSITVTAERTGASLKIHIRVAGSPAASPLGTLEITAPGTQIHTLASLEPAAAGLSEAEVTVLDASTNGRTVHVVYSGDSHYTSGTQDARTTEIRHHATGR